MLCIHQRLESCEGSDGLLPVLNPPWRDEQGSCEFSSNLSFDPVWNNMFFSECSRFYFSFERPFVRRHAIDASMENLRFLLKKRIRSICIRALSDIFTLSRHYLFCVWFLSDTFVSRRLFVSLAPDCGKFFSILGAKDDVIMKDMALMSCINKILSFYISCKQNTCPSKDKISLHFFFWNGSICYNR